MQFGYSETCLDHDTGPRHPENPDRLRAIRRRLAKRHGVVYREASPADRESVAAVHTPAYVDEVQEFADRGGGNWDADTVASEATWEAALASAGLAQWAVREAMDGANGRETPFSLGRPPGHHAIEDDAMGFCFFNNAAIAAQTALDSTSVERVAIFDWDVHHGNGTQDLFYDRGDVFYASIHEDGLYPGTGEIDETGTGSGAGSTLNVPFPAGADDADYEYAITEAVVPAFESFDPDLLIVSAGFDAHRHDPISRMRVSTEGYALFTQLLRRFGDRTSTPLAFVLEGGYGLETLSDGVAAVHETFDGRDPTVGEGEPSPDAKTIVDGLLERIE
ncbi:Histone deacetylase [Halalkaliarchaeum sp. AArc-CO]|uniref:histone deacetylase family protein n=1 Tax=unclassified Halalkaliarchaeum TaxID=2678344 RepID=UPI00217E0D27|nr:MULTISPECIES: histone deacetylase [unclassified Halalkaliarchaeum]MDR5673016.1 histone deacetylase [Halalkaliarchaeum sp. AArc-GB]UWG49495.1 Histone deacetylase [Halalkaliarchaeum sp. AArc-CO]